MDKLSDRLSAWKGPPYEYGVLWGPNPDKDTLVRVLKDVLEWIADPKMTTWTYLESTHFHRGRLEQVASLSTIISALQEKDM